MQQDSGGAAGRTFSVVQEASKGVAREPLDTGDEAASESYRSRRVVGRKCSEAHLWEQPAQHLSDFYIRVSYNEFLSSHLVRDHQLEH